MSSPGLPTSPEVGASFTAPDSKPTTYGQRLQAEMAWDIYDQLLLDPTRLETEVDSSWQLHDISEEHARDLAESAARYETQIKNDWQESQDAIKEAGLDDLTGLPRRGAFYEYAIPYLQRAVFDFQHSGNPDNEIRFIMLDAKGLKRINDTLGTDEGDIAIKEFAQCVASSLRPGQFVARWGGDELLVFDSSIDKDASAALVERMAQSVRNGTKHKTEIRGASVALDLSVIQEAEELYERSDKSENGPTLVDYVARILAERAGKAMIQAKESGEIVVDYDDIEQD